MLEIPAKRSFTDSTIGVPLDADPKPSQRRRLLLTIVLVSIGAIATTIGLSSIAYRLTHLTINNSLINGRTVRLRAPIDGTIKEFYAQPGVPVKQGQILVRIAPTLQEDQHVLQLQGEQNSTAAQLAASQQTLTLLQQQLSRIESQDQSIQGANTTLASNDIRRYQAAVDGARAKARSARLDYQRNRQLLNEGVVAQQKVDQLKAVWQSSEADIKQAQADLDSAQTTHAVLKEGTSLKASDSLLNQRVNLAQAIQSQLTLIKILSAQLATKKSLLAQAQAAYTARKDLAVTAPFSGIIYRTEQEQGEQVNRPSNLLTILDCNDLWVETLVGVDQADRTRSPATCASSIVG